MPIADATQQKSQQQHKTFSPWTIQTYILEENFYQCLQVNKKYASVTQLSLKCTYSKSVLPVRSYSRYQQTPWNIIFYCVLYLVQIQQQ